MNKYINPKKNNSVPICIDLFSGAGGLTLGFCQAGGLPIAAVDNDPDSIETYKQMFPMCEEIFCGDIEQWKPNNTYKKNVDVVIGGPPCQGFSLARGLRFVDDPRNHLYKEFVRLVATFQPKWLVLENVQGITNIGGGIILKQIYEDFNAIGYTLTHRVINMAEYGVPQLRKRAVFVGNRFGKEFQWPETTHSKKPKNGQMQLNSHRDYRAIHEAISDLPWALGSYFAHRANSKMRGPRNRNVFTEPAFTLRVRGDEFAFCEKPAEKAFIPDSIPDESDFYYLPMSSDYQKMMREVPPPWIKNFQKPRQVDRKNEVLKGTRRLSTREQARLQSFPDWFQFYGRPYSKGRQIGNAVPPLFAKQLFESIFKQSPEEISRQKTALPSKKSQPSRNLKHPVESSVNSD